MQDLGPAKPNLGLLPDCRAEEIDDTKGSRLFIKEIFPPDEVSCNVPVGKRIGF